MARSAALLVLPTPEATREKEAPPQPTAALLVQSLEDLRLAESVERALHAAGYGSLRAVQVTVHARRVILWGRVPSYYLKQLAQQTALAVPGAHEVGNGLEVIQPS
jgi:osmotically-inducible protein OsmY